ncbi:MAG: hypothetical protein ACK5NY_01700 [Burkholderiaceae bacterium]|jgi:hypothetical protein
MPHMDIQRLPQASATATQYTDDALRALPGEQESNISRAFGLAMTGLTGALGGVTAKLAWNALDGGQLVKAALLVAGAAIGGAVTNGVSQAKWWSNVSNGLQSAPKWIAQCPVTIGYGLAAGVMAAVFAPSVAIRAALGGGAAILATEVVRSSVSKNPFKPEGKNATYLPV